MVHVLVTGAGGFSGAHLVAALLECGHDVSAVVRRSRGELSPEGNETGRLKIITVDLTQPSSLPERVDAIIHIAATSPGPGISITDMVRDNVVATAQLAAYARCCMARRFVFFSSLSIYGTVRDSQVDENTQIKDPDVYGSTKFIGEALLKELADQGHCSTLMLRLPGVIGPTSHRNWLSGVVKAAKEGREISLYNPDAAFNNAVHISDLCRFVIHLLQHGWVGSDDVTLGASGMTTVRKAVETLVTMLEVQIDHPHPRQRRSRKLHDFQQASCGAIRLSSARHRRDAFEVRRREPWSMI